MMRSGLRIFMNGMDSLVCETIFIIAYDKIKNTISD